MTDVGGPGRRTLPPLLGWVLGLALGLGLGALCRYPLVWTWLTGWALAWQVGWASIDPTLVDDGVGVIVVFVGVLWALFAWIAVPLTLAARRVTGLSPRRWWWTSGLSWIAPFAVLDLPRLLG